MRTVILRDAYDALLKRIKELDKEIKLNSKEIGRAAELGDLSENAEFDAAKEKQTELFNTLNNLENYVHARIIEPNEINTKVVSFGTTVKFFDYTENKVDTYTIVGPAEFELGIYPNIMTFNSPLGQALNGKKKGTVVDIDLPRGLSKFLILDIRAVSIPPEAVPEIVIFGETLKHSDGHFGGAGYYAAAGASMFTDRIAPVTVVDKKDKDLVEALSQIAKLDKAVILDPKAEISFANLPKDYYGAKFFHITSMEPSKQLEILTALSGSDEIDGKLSVEIDEQYLKSDKDTIVKIMELADILFVTEAVFKLLEKIEHDEKSVILRKGHESAEFWYDDDMEQEAEALEVEVVDPDGFESVMAGAFVGVMALDHLEEVALDLAMKLACKSTEDKGVDHLIHPKHDD